jgi:hypothetical protein
MWGWVRSSAVLCACEVSTATVARHFFLNECYMTQIPYVLSVLLAVNSTAVLPNCAHGDHIFRFTITSVTVNNLLPAGLCDGGVVEYHPRPYPGPQQTNHFGNHLIVGSHLHAPHMWTAVDQFRETGSCVSGGSLQ